MARLCISIPVHEQLDVVFDQIENIRAFTPDDTLIVIHAAAGFVDNLWLQSIVPDGVYINPNSVPNDWGFEVANYGTVVPQHQSNFRYMTQVVKKPFDYFLLEASNDLFFMPGVHDYIVSSQADAGVQQHPITPQHHDPGTLHQMASHYGVEVRHSQVEGQFYKTEVFEELSDKLDAQWGPRSRMTAAEEWWYSTLVQTVTSNLALPYIYAETHWEMARHAPTPVLVDALRNRTYAEDLMSDLTALSGDVSDFGYIPGTEIDYQNAYAIKRVVRDFGHPLRVYIRGLTRQHAPFLKLPKTADFGSFNAGITLDEVLANPNVLRNYARDFTSSDDAALVIMTAPEQTAQLTLLEAAIKDAGLDQPGAGEVVAYVRPMSFEQAAYLSRILDVMITTKPIGGPFIELIQMKPVLTGRLRLLADIRAKAT